MKSPPTTQSAGQCRRHSVWFARGKLDFIPTLDPAHNAKGRIKALVRDPATPTTKDNDVFAPSPIGGMKKIWDSQTNIHNPMFDDKSRVWLTARTRPAGRSRLLPGRLEPSFGQAVPAEGIRTPAGAVRSRHQKNIPRSIPATARIICNWRPMRTTRCGPAAARCGGVAEHQPVPENGDEQKAQGWTALVLDTNGTASAMPITEPGAPQDPAKDMRIPRRLLWRRGKPGGWFDLGFDPGAIPAAWSAWCREVIRPPRRWRKSITRRWTIPRRHCTAFSPRGMDIDRNGVVWMPLASGQFRQLRPPQMQGPAQRTQGDG